MQQSQITILTEVPYSAKQLPSHLFKLLKARIRKLLFLLTRAPKFLPDAEIEDTLASLKRGFDALRINYVFNPGQRVSQTVGVIASPDALRWALQKKREGTISALIAGPAISILPSDHDRLMADTAIDKVIVPTKEVKTVWTENDQYFNDKAVIWTAGVEDTGAGRDPNGVCIVYSRNADEKIFSQIMETLWEHKVPIAVSNYGQFRSREYVNLLKKAKFLIYLTDFSSQPLPLYEAWMADVPSLVNTPSLSTISPECGLTFTGMDDFEAKLIEFQERYASFKPRPYALSHHTDSISAGAYRSIIESV